jgi:hypothetical protein
MFSKPEQLIRRTGKKGVGRYDYLQQLVTEFQETDSTGACDPLLPLWLIFMCGKWNT